MNFDDEATKTRIERNKLRAAMDKILAIVSPENDPDDVDLSLDGIVENVRRLQEYAEETTERMNAAHAETLAFRRAFTVYPTGMWYLNPLAVDKQFFEACSAHDARIKAEAEAF